MAHDNPLRIPEPLRHDAEEIFKLTDPFCSAHLDAEYGELVRALIAKLARKRPSPLARGDLRIWAGAAIYAVGSVNFLFDPTQRPHLTGDQLSELTGVPKSTLANKAKVIRDVLRIGPLEPEFCRRERLDSNPMLRLPVRRTRAKQTDQGRKLSEIIKEMGLRLFKEPDAAASLPAVETAILLASAAWNAALGDHGLRDQHREMLKKFDWGGRQPWPELVSTDTDGLIAGLIEYKQARHPDDRRRIVAAETRSDGNVRVHWVGEDNLVAATFGSRMSTVTAAIARSGYPIAEKLVARMKREKRGKVVDLKSAIAGRAAAEELQRTVVTKEGLATFHPAHAAYVYAQNQVSVMSEQLTALDEMAPFADIVSKAEDLYMPSGPPISPLTMSYFTCWAFFDACVEPTGETIGTTVLEVGAAFGMHTELLRLIRLMQESRMGLYAHEGTEGSLLILRELATDAVCHAIVPSGYRGQRGELWYARVLPSPILGGSEHVVFTTPYVVLKPGIHEWQAYLRRTLPDAPRQARIDANERHMKYGPTRTYWNDFVFEGYVNHRTEAIYLAGLPDVPESRPHSQVNSRRFRR